MKTFPAGSVKLTFIKVKNIFKDFKFLNEKRCIKSKLMWRLALASVAQ